jgi:Fur family ferric uptake transcriptional regulator
MNKRRHGWQKKLNMAGFRLTNPRGLVMDILKKTEKHLSAEEIYIQALSINPSIGLTTVYRTLDLFTRIGAVQKFDFGDGKSRFELIENTLKKGHHHHLVCISCKSVIDYTDFMNEELELMQKTERALSKKYHFKINHHTVDFYGLCHKCQAQR